MTMPPANQPQVDPLAALLSAILPGLGHFVRGRHQQGASSFIVAVLLIGLSGALGRISGRAAEVLFFMILALPWWAIQSYDAYLGPSNDSPDWRRTWREVWQQGHDIRFLGLLLLISALNDTWIILKNLDYLLPFYCTKPDGIPGFLTKAISPALHVAVGYGFMRLRRWSLFVYLLYAAYGFTNALVNLTCFGPGRIRNTLLAAIVLSTIYLLWRRRILLAARKS
ncbi:MAG TPA: hypothetical protein VKP13_17805 [Nitrospira sp.]|nr:hypothetical protein [Nitrospira sp.]